MGPLFPESTLQGLRAMNADNLPHSCVRYAFGTVYGPGGVTDEDWGPVDGGPWPCRATRAGNTEAERVRADQVTGEATWVVVFAAGTRVGLQERLVVTGVEAGVAFELHLEVLDAGPRANEVMHKCLCREGQFNPADMGG